jgi:glycosyltransferase involved in cell wall biosynthesis
MDPLDPVADRDAAPTVAVVIPTRGRLEFVLRAVQSALHQTRRPDEVIVVLDGPDRRAQSALEAVEAPEVHVVVLPKNLGAAGARNAGVRAATADLVAFLDDDDEWLPEKLAVQLGEFAATPPAARATTVLACGVEWRTGTSTHYWPLRSPREGEPVAEYLFVRRKPGEGLLATPTVVAPRRLLLETPFQEGVEIHEDFDWFLDLEQRGVRFSVVLETLVVVHAPPVRDSLSRNETWQTSLRWARGRRRQLGARAFSAFCLTEVARTARRQAGARAFMTILVSAFAGRPSPYELSRYLYIWLLPERARWTLSGRPWRHHRRQ